MFKNDKISFAQESAIDENDSYLYFKLLIIDDEESVHDITKLALSKKLFLGRKLKLLHAYSALQGAEILEQNPDTAVVLLDVVMESDSAGLDLIKIIRDELENSSVRIILRTGQPGAFPEEEVIVKYDINDYKDKTELTADRLFSCIITALRSYRDLSTIEKNRLGLEKVLSSTSHIINLHSMDNFFSGLLDQVVTLMYDENTHYLSEPSVYLVFYQESKNLFEMGTGMFKEKGERDIRLAELYQGDIEKVILKQENFKTDKHCIYYHHNDDDSGVLMLYEGNIANICVEDSLLNLFIKNTAITYDNLLMSNDIKESQKETIFLLSEMAEQRSKETGKHVKRVAYFAKEIAIALELTPKEIEEVFTSAPMHDIGKIAIVDKILKKPGRLDEDELDSMRLHAVKGYELLKNSEKRIMQMAAIVAHEHHEYYDGSGYPQGLQGEEIHIYARITALSDVFDALSSKRVYKDAWELERVLDFIRENRGKQFDPKVVDAFFTRIDTILELLEEHKDDMSDDAFNFA